MTFSRRFFLKSGSIALIGFGSGIVPVPRFLARAAETAKGKGKVLVVLFQRGAADGLNIVVPHGEPAYYDLRPNIAIARPGKGREGSAIDLDGHFGLHPVLQPFKELFDQKRLAVIHAAGSPDATRSHFDAQDFMESGTPGVKSTSDGWLNRYMQHAHLEDPSKFRAVSLSSDLPRILAGSAPALAIPELSRFGFDDRRGSGMVKRGLERMYGASEDGLLAPTAGDTFEAVDYLKRVDPASYRPQNGASYPPGRFGQTMLQIAQLIKAGVGLEIAFAEIGGWDHHVNEGGATGPLANLLRGYAGGVGAFVQDLGRKMDDVVVVTLSEFGRTAKENGNRGTDHGHANAMFVLGGPVRGGKLYGEWPGLARDDLYEGRDLALTTDFRDVVGELLVGHLGGGQLDAVFPGHAIDARRFKGLV